jgi:hypothetical protein
MIIPGPWADADAIATSGNTIARHLAIVRRMPMRPRRNNAAAPIAIKATALGSGTGVTGPPV